MTFLLLDCNHFFAKKRFEDVTAVLYFGNHYHIEYKIYPDEIAIKEIWLNEYPDSRVLILGDRDE